MTEYWKSHAMHWCELCRCWMNDTKAAIANHERGSKHQEALARKLRDMSNRADAEKKEAEDAAAALARIEAAAAARYEADKRAAAAQAGSWVWVEASGYYYNAKYRWYYDHKTGWYYGGDPVEWTQKPALPSAALFGVAPHEGGDAPQKPAGGGAGAAAGAGAAGAGSVSAVAAAAAAATAAGQHAVVKKTVMQLPAHPQAMIGGHQMPVSGRIGGAKGVGASDEPAAAAAAAADGKRKRPAAAAPAAGAKKGGSSKPVDPAEAEALARREAARRRVEERTKQAYGLT